MFTLDSRLQQDTIPAGEFPLSRLLLMNDSTYPWLILVPQRPEIREIFQLSDADQKQLLHESVQLSRALDSLCRPDKLNIAALGNLVPQLHLHHVVRYRTDPAWPAPVWGKSAPVAYPAGKAQAFLQKLVPLLADFTAASPR